MTDPLQPLIDRYATIFREHGPTPRGAGWSGPTDEHAADAFQTHARALLGVFRPPPFGTLAHQGSLLEFGCGYGAVYEYMRDAGYAFDYTGIDIFRPAIESARTKFPGVDFRYWDSRVDGLPGRYDYAITNVFNASLGMDKAEFWTFMVDTVRELYEATDRGVAFCTYSSHVDYETDDFFHVPFDRMAEFVQTLTRSFVFRCDYRWPSYTTYLYHGS